MGVDWEVIGRRFAAAAAYLYELPNDHARPRPNTGEWYAAQARRALGGETPVAQPPSTWVPPERVAEDVGLTTVAHERWMREGELRAETCRADRAEAARDHWRAEADRLARHARIEAARMILRHLDGIESRYRREGALLAAEVLLRGRTPQGAAGERPMTREDIAAALDRLDPPTTAVGLPA